MFLQRGWLHLIHNSSSKGFQKPFYVKGGGGDTLQIFFPKAVYFLGANVLENQSTDHSTHNSEKITSLADS